MSRTDLAVRTISRAALQSERPEPVAGLLDELARAMLVAAEHERERLVASVVDEADAQTHKVRARAAVEAAEFKRLAEEDADEIHARAIAEIERIRTRAERRIVVRRGRLERHLVGHATIIESEIGRVDAAVEAYGCALDAFVGRLRGQRDPGEIAHLANALPATPDFDALRSAARAEAMARLAGVASVGAATAAAADGSGHDPTDQAVPAPPAQPAGAVASALVGVMDPEMTHATDDTGTVSRVMRTLAAWTSSSGRGT